MAFRYGCALFRATVSVRDAQNKFEVPFLFFSLNVYSTKQISHDSSDLALHSVLTFPDDGVLIIMIRVHNTYIDT